MNQIKIGTIVNAPDFVPYMEQIVDYGFECFALAFNQHALTMDLKETAKRVNDFLGPMGIEISCVSCYGNPLQPEGHHKNSVECMEALIDAAHEFGTDLVTGFAGRLRGLPVEDSIPKYKEVFSELSKRAEANGVKIAFENCPGGGGWNSGMEDNIAFNPKAWELMFDALPAENIGLEWEPCHQLCQLMDPVAQLRKWAKKVFHVHGKDATIMWDVIREKGIDCGEPFFYHRTPGFGDTNWNDIITILRQNGYEGNIDIEGWHDVVYRDDLEMMGQVRGLNYLKDCRGGTFYPNPSI